MIPSYRCIKTFRTETTVLYEQPSEKGRLFTESRLDDAGNIASTITYGERGAPIETVSCVYDGAHRLLEETIEQLTDKQTQKRVFEYRENPHSVIERTIYSDGGESRTESFYNADGKIEKIDQYIDGENPDSSERFEYNTEGKLASHITLDCDGRTIAEDRLTHEGSITTVVHMQDGEESIDIHHLNDRGQIIKIEHGSRNAISSEENHEYDGKGRLTKTAALEFGELITERHTEYDEKGNRTAEETQDHRYRRVDKVARTFDGDGRQLTEERFSTFGGGESYRMEFVYE